MVAKPLVMYLLEHTNVDVTVASRTVEKAEVIIGGHAAGNPRSFDITVRDDLNDLVSEHDLAVSLLPYVHHPKVARARKKVVRMNPI